jgi:hypothetical protein
METRPMLLSKRLMKKTVWLSTVSLLYAALGLPLIHPLFHDPCEKHCCLTGISDRGPQASIGNSSVKPLPRHSHCPICSFLQQLHTYHESTFVFLDSEPYFSKAALPLIGFLTKPFEYEDLLPRPPPLFV